MIKKILLPFLALQTICVAAYADQQSFFLQKQQPKHIFIHNRILAEINGKPISVVDLIKKMDMVFYRQYPQYSGSVEARYQFYMMSWKHVLKELIEKELIVADAAEVKVEISNGDVRQEMENIFGPNIIANLDKAGLTYEEASKLIREELLLKRMMMMRVHAKAVRSVTPSDVRAAYEEHAKTHTTPKSWRYYVISVRQQELAEKLFREWKQKTHTPEELSDTIKKILGEEALSAVTISEEYFTTEKDISDSYRKILSEVEAGALSAPVSQKRESSNTYKIFYLKEFTPPAAPLLSEVELSLKNQLVEKKVDQESERYLNRLYKHFNVEREVQPILASEDFQPFVLR